MKILKCLGYVRHGPNKSHLSHETYGTDGTYSTLATTTRDAIPSADKLAGNAAVIKEAAFDEGKPPITGDASFLGGECLRHVKMACQRDMALGT